MMNIFSNITYIHARTRQYMQPHILYFWQKFVKLRMHTQQQKFLVEIDFADSTLKFKGLELNLKDFFMFCSDIYDWFNNAVFLFSSSIVHESKAP